MFAQSAIASADADQSGIDAGVTDGGDTRVRKHPTQHLQLCAEQALATVEQGFDALQNLRPALEPGGKFQQLRRHASQHVDPVRHDRPGQYSAIDGPGERKLADGCLDMCQGIVDENEAGIQVTDEEQIGDSVSGVQLCCEVVAEIARQGLPFAAGEQRQFA